jgi:hypothetical protein
MNSDEGIYLIHTREFISTNVSIYKIGRSNYLDNRVKQYPNGSKILLMIACKNSKSCENNLKNLFKSKFIQKPYYGIEYFEGNYIDMIKEICDYINNINVLITEEIEKMSDVKSEIIEVLPEVAEVLPEVAEVLPENVEVKTININKNKDKISDKVCDRTCPKCKKQFEYPSLLKRHFKISSRCSLPIEDIELFFNPINNSITCNICNNIYSRKDSLIRHLKSSSCSKLQNTK